tara:strand:- start:32275 stop:33411 length:1137 start_codon:yes stop_codon:yes gene_type:complete
VNNVELHILGTASARPSGAREVSGSLLSCDDGIAVIDAGEGFQMRYAAQRKRLKTHTPSGSLRAARIDVVCLTHGHLDHTWGVLPWLQTMALDRRTRPLLIVGPTSPQVIEALLGGQPVPEAAPPAELARQMQSWHSLGAVSEHLGYDVRWVLGDVETDEWVELDVATGGAVRLPTLPQPEGWSQVRIRPLATQHTVPSCAWMFESKQKAGKFNRLKAAELRLTTEQQTELGQGRDVTLSDGETLHAADFREASIHPRRLIVSGDTAEQAKGLIALESVDVLVHESTFLEDTADHALEHLHSTASGAVRTALACGANHLVLTHFSARIKDGEVPLNEALRAASASPLNISLANDGARIQLHPDGHVTHLVWSEDGWTS